jgi:hypothetical protein
MDLHYLQNSIYDLRCFLGTTVLFTMAVAAHYIISGLAMVIGTARRLHLVTLLHTKCPILDHLLLGL